MDRLRLFQGEADLGGMLEVSDESMLMDGMGMINDPDSFRAVYSGYMDSLPSENAIVAEARGSIVGQGLVWWRDVAEGQRIYSYSTSVLPEFLDDRAGLMDWAEARLIRTASQHPPGIEKVLETQAVQGTRLESMVRARGYAPARRFVEMVRSLDDIPVVPAPGGISIMPAAEETICEAWAVAGGPLRTTGVTARRTGRRRGFRK